ncbi:ROK family protein [Actinophytocola sp.]|uniref:ROK family protein n=1 Tax=Actinophytocola sp. TaxID=1872138 RepID=UPI00389A941B
MSSQPRHWRSAAEALAVLRQQARLTRPELGRRLGLGSGPTSDLVGRMARGALISERPAGREGRGRPTTTVHAHPRGPVAVVLDIRHGDWRLGTCEVDGTVEIVESGQHDSRSPEQLVDRLRTRVRATTRSLGDRLAGIGVAVPGPTADDRLVHATMLGWHDVDIRRVAPDAEILVAVGNDATMAAVAEARLHTPRPRTLLHVVVEIGVGGAFVADGRPVRSARGLHGEFGHLPFGDPGVRCPCGALGCWAIAFDLPQIARGAGRRIRQHPRTWLHGLFTDPRPSPKVRDTREALAADLGRGIAGLVNALDPDVVTLGGLASELRASSPEGFEHAVDAGLMTVHRDRPPSIVAARGGEDAPLIGAGLEVFERVLDADMLARWASRVRGVRP